MARGLVRKPSFNKIVGAYRSQWKRFWMRLFTFGMYGRKGMGWWRDPKKAWYNWWYRRSSISVYRILGCKPSRGACFFACLFASAFSIVASPIDATRAGVKAHKIKTERKKRAESSGSRSGQGGTSFGSSARSAGATTNRSHTNNSSSYGSSSRDYSSSAKEFSTPRTSPATSVPKESTTIKTSSATTVRSTTSNASSAQRKPKTPAKQKQTTSVSYTAVPPRTEEKPKPTYTYTPIYTEPIVNTPPAVDPEQLKEPDENTPKSKPKHEKDQYIRKRMVIAGSSYCDANMLAKLSVGTYFDLVAEPDNPHDKDAVMLTLDGENIGYIAKTDRLAFVTCLKLKRKIYGVITAIDKEATPTKYEFETWFDQSK